MEETKAVTIRNNVLVPTAAYVRVHEVLSSIAIIIHLLYNPSTLMYLQEGSTEVVYSTQVPLQSG